MNTNMILSSSQFPYLCPFSDATYCLFVTDNIGREVVTDGPHFMPWIGSSSEVTMELRQGLVANTHYRANITVTTMAGQSFYCFSLGMQNSTI